MALYNRTQNRGGTTLGNLSRLNPGSGQTAFPNRPTTLPVRLRPEGMFAHDIGDIVPGSPEYFDLYRRLGPNANFDNPFEVMEQAQKDLRQYQITLDPRYMQPEYMPGTMQPFRQPERPLPQAPGTYQFNPMTKGAFDPMSQALRDEQIANIFGGGDEQEKVWRFQDFYRALIGSSLGLGKYRDQGPIDPLAQLQQQLQGQYDPSVIGGLTQNQDFDSLLRQRQDSLRQQLNQRAAGMGVEGAYAGVMAQSERARNALAERARAAYQPAAFQTQQQLQDQTNQILQAINQAELEQERIFATSGAG